MLQIISGKTALLLELLFGQPECLHTVVSELHQEQRSWHARKLCRRARSEPTELVELHGCRQAKLSAQLLGVDLLGPRALHAGWIGKTPKLHLGDLGLSCALLGADTQALTADRQLLGQLLEIFLFQELRRQVSWQEREVAFYHFRDKDGAEVDIVLERGAREVAGVEVKATATVTASDFRGLHKLKDATGRRFAAGVVLYDGESCAGFGDRLHAVPIRALWETT